ncbi:MAG: YihY/virulence factor BrkB family protein [Acidobacteriaceae bacterium]
MVRIFHNLRRAVWSAFGHGAFSMAKAAAYSAILSIFPAMLVLTTLFALMPAGSTLSSVLRAAFEQVLPSDTMRLVQSYFAYNHARSIRIICGSVFVTIYAAMGMLLSLMDGFRRAYRVPHGQWGFWKERVVALALVPAAMIPMAAATMFLAFGHSIEQWMIANTNLQLHRYLILVWRLTRWMIALFASIVSLALVYHYAVPRQKLRTRSGRFHLVRARWRETLPGATIATATWFIATLIYGWYLTRFSDYSIVYGSLGAGVVTLVWLYMVSLIILIGAEFNAQMFPLTRAGDARQDGAGQENVAPQSAAV